MLDARPFLRGLPAAEQPFGLELRPPKEDARLKGLAVLGQLRLLERRFTKATV